MAEDKKPPLPVPTGTRLVANVKASAQVTDGAYKAATSKPPGAITTEGASTEGSTFFSDIIGEAKSVFSGIREPVISIAGWLDIAFTGIGALAGKFSRGIEEFTGKLIGGITGGVSGLIGGVFSGAETLLAPLTDAAQAANAKLGGFFSGGAEGPGLLGRAISFVGSAVKSAADAISSGLQAGIDKLTPDAVATPTELGLAEGSFITNPRLAELLEAPEPGFFASIGISALDAANKFVQNFAKANSTEAITARGAAFISKSKLVYENAKAKIASTAADRVEEVVETALDDATAPITNTLDFVEDTAKLAQRTVDTVSSAFARNGGKAEAPPSVTIAAAAGGQVNIADIQNNSANIKVYGTLCNMRTETNYVEQLAGAVVESAEEGIESI